MSLISQPFNPLGEQLPAAFDGCTCDCHQIAGVMHVIACCGVSVTPLFKFEAPPTMSAQDWADLAELKRKLESGEISAESPFEGMDEPWSETDKTNLKLALSEIFSWEQPK